MTSGLLSDTPPFFMEENSSVVDFATTTVARGIQNGLPQQSLPFSGAMPVAGGASGGSAPSFGGAGPDLGGVLTLLLASLLSAKFLWYARKFLRPDSVYGLIVNQPG